VLVVVASMGVASGMGVEEVDDDEDEGEDIW